MIVAVLLVGISAETADWLLPKQVHIAYGDTDFSLVVMWVTFRPTNSTAAELCLDGKCWRGDMRLFLFRDEDNADYEPIPRYVHKVNVTQLAVARTYSYRVGCEESGIWSQSFRFQGPKVTFGGPRRYNSTRFIDFGDFGTCSPKSLPTLSALSLLSQRLFHDFLILDGDIAYNLYMFNGVRGDEFLQKSEAFAAFTPFMVVAGNHERFDNYSHFKTLWDMPQDTQNFYYSFDVGPAHFVIFATEFLCSAEHCPILQERQLRWLESDLKEANQHRAERPWLFVFSHKPLYCSVDWENPKQYEDCVLDTAERRHIYEDLLAYYKVDIYFQAHVHNYERFQPVYQNRAMGSEVSGPHLYVNPSATVYVLSGSAGSCKGDDDIDMNSSTPESFSLFRTNELSYTDVEANLTSVAVRQISSFTGDVLDYFYLVKF